MKYFYCQSYQAFNMALAMHQEGNIIVISAAKNIIKACNFLKIDYVEHIPFSKRQFVINSNQVETEAERILEVIGNNEFHFSHTQFAVFCFYIVKKLNDRKGLTIFHNFEFVYGDPNLFSFCNRSYLATKLYHAILIMKYDLPVEVRMSSKVSFMISLNISYIENNCCEIIDNREQYYDCITKMFQNFAFDYPEVNNLFIASTFSNEAFFQIEKINIILPIFNNEKIAVKNHPKLGNVKGLEKCEIIPDFLPVELFFQKVKRNIISFHSASLITASKFKNVNTVSLLDLVKTEDPFMEEVKKDMEKKSNNLIWFPQTITEVKELIDA